MKKLIRKIQFILRDFFINRKYRKKLKNKNFTIISNDCIGGCIYKDLKMRFLTPTINLYFVASDFIKFVENLKEFIENGVLEEYKCDEVSYPISILKISSGEQVVMHCLHYKSFEEFKETWEKRKQRINYNDMFFVLNDRNGFTEDDLKNFDSLSYKNKVCFVHKPMPEYKSAFYLKGSENDEYVKSTVSYVKKLGIKRYYDQFDFISWLNG